MTLGDYLLIPVVIFLALLYPMLRKALSLFEIWVNKYVQQANNGRPVGKEKQTPVQTILNLKLLAYERVILFIERMKPDSLVPRTLSPSLSAKEYQLLLVNEIRKEFEYNLSQQLYLSESAWKVTVSFKDNVITLINSAAAECAAGQAGDLARKVLERYIASDLKVDQLLSLVKADIQ